MNRKRYALVGTGSRSRMYIDAIAGNFSDTAELVAFCDINQTRMDFMNRRLREKFRHAPVPTYRAEEFRRMVQEEKPDTVIVLTWDRTHHRYIIAAMELGCDVVTEKPLTTDDEKCRAILDAREKYSKKISVTFNYRYSPRNTRIKELINSGAIGDVVSVHFEWMLDTRHGADYFRRWHRDKNNSGGLMVHKSTHHFDLVNWWLDSEAESVFAMGRLAFYGRENAEQRGVTEFYERCRENPVAAVDPFALDMSGNELMKGLYLEAEHEDGYIRDQSVFGHNISIEDSMSVMVKYRNKAVMTYSLNAFCPMEGYNVSFNGTKGRIEVRIVERPYVSGSTIDQNDPDYNMREDGAVTGRSGESEASISLQQIWGEREAITWTEGKGGHGGGDGLLLEDVFKPGREDPLKTAAGLEDGVNSIMVGIAANRSFATGKPVHIRDLLRT
ncbi:dehydrogenase [Marispirochaeta aestuarii]|uniref:Dehydrogenase n=1 Tax=Marispirochaeta aestuarii TaxID=1963862 RepID=A0A1Y1RVQ7_9SPIO|nr:Gfo/Idh/MocA family oxidoreductase [Marispirochaeta aestuarii]ORC34110.1 dehydrogenase [Marispirochaeta aestuarii]